MKNCLLHLLLLGGLAVATTASAKEPGWSGTVIARDGHGANETFTVRRISFGIGVEKVFPVHSPYIEKIEVERSAHVRRAKLYYLRDLRGKKARLREKKA
mgnify:CR=1 FL=1